MKKNLFSTMLALLTIVAMLVSVGCKNYDDDISDINKKISSLESATAQISTLESKVTSLESSVATLNSTVSGLSTDLKNLNTMVTDAKKDIADLKTAVASKVDAAEVQKMIDAAVADLDKKVDGALKDLEQLKKDVQAAVDSIPAQVKAEVEASIEAVKKELYSFVTSTLTSIVFVPGGIGETEDGNMSTGYVNGIESVIFGEYTYTPLKAEGQDSKDETWKADAAKASVKVRPDVTVYYDINPATATVDMTNNKDKYTLSVYNLDDAVLKSVSENCKLEIIDWTASEGKLAVKMRLTGKPAEGDVVSRFAIKASYKDERIGERSVVSDYAGLVVDNFKDFYLADASEWHLRRGVAPKGIDDGDGCSDTPHSSRFGTGKPAWKETTTLAEAVEYSDTTCEYQSTLDLAKFVKVHYDITGAKDPDACIDLSDKRLEQLGFSVKYEVVKNFKFGIPATDQADFVDLVDGHVFTPKTYSTTGTSCIGRSPIVRVSLCHGDDVVKVAYVRVTIIRGENKFDINVTPIFKDIYEGQKDTVKVEDMNLIIYNAMKMSKSEFHANYPKFEDIDKDNSVKNKPAGTDFDVVNLLKIDPSTSTYSLEWVLSDNAIWENSGAKDVQHKVRFYNDNGESVYVTLHADIYEITKTFVVKEKVENYWKNNATLYNVTVPNFVSPAGANWSDPVNCYFESNINASFVTDENTKMVVLKENPAPAYPSEKDVDSLCYYFNVHHIQKLGLTYDEDNTVKAIFSVTPDSDVLSVQGYGSMVKPLAEIKNGTKGNNVITYTKPDQLSNIDNAASALLNKTADYMTTCISANGYLKGRADRKVTILFFDKDTSFTAKFLRPVNVNTKSGKAFTDGVDFGKAGSYIALDTLLNATDWRNEPMGKFEYNVASYWYYYGSSKFAGNFWDISVETSKATITWKAGGSPVALPNTFELGAVYYDHNTATPVSFGVPAQSSYFGFITYKNNGTRLTEPAVITVPVTVKYGWGVYKGKVDITVNPLN